MSGPPDDITIIPAGIDAWGECAGAAAQSARLVEQVMAALCTVSAAGAELGAVFDIPIGTRRIDVDGEEARCAASWHAHERVRVLLPPPGDLLDVAARVLEPHKIATYLYELARDLNRYYETTPIAVGDVTDVEKQARLRLLQKVSQIFNHGLNLLGIEVPSSM